MWVFNILNISKTGKQEPYKVQEPLVYYMYFIQIGVYTQPWIGKLTRRRVRRSSVMVWPVVEVQLSREQCGENVVRVVRITTRHTFQINRGARYCTPDRKMSTPLDKWRRWRRTTVVATDVRLRGNDVRVRCGLGHEGMLCWRPWTNRRLTGESTKTKTSTSRI